MSRVVSASLAGVDGVPVEVEVRISSQLPRIDVVGLPEAAVRESAARVRAAVSAAGHEFPNRRITVNLAPANLRKSGAELDLPIAIGILAASGAVPQESVTGLGLFGELALDGRLRPARGALALTLAVRDAGCPRVVVPAASGAEAALAPGIEVQAAADLGALVAHLVGGHALPQPLPAAHFLEEDAGPDLRDVRGQERGKRALELAAAGGHALLFFGPPGCGKTMLARRLPGLLPPLGFEEALDATRVHGAAGLLDALEPIVRTRPFRAPHHSASRAGLLGGGSPARPGEVSLAHRGVLFLDELPEFERRVLESLRQVLEDRCVVIARARGSVTLPAAFQLIAAANPCPCGWRLSRQRDCRCDRGALERYAARISGPLLDRIDLHVPLPGVAWKDLDGAPGGEDTASVRARVGASRRRQLARGWLNAMLPDTELDAAVQITPDARALLGQAADRLRLSARALRRALRVARSIADLADRERVDREAVAEALGFKAELDGG